MHFVCRDGLLGRLGPRGGRLCVPATEELRVLVLRELHALLGRHFGRDTMLALAPLGVATWLADCSGETA